MAGGAAVDEPDSPMIDQHYVYSLRDFQPFESGTYQGKAEMAVMYIAGGH